MNNTAMPSLQELPSTARLLRSTGIAMLVALLLLVTAVMPAEYGIDPTGIGRLLGLQAMGEIKSSAQASEKAATAATTATTTTAPTTVTGTAPVAPAAAVAPAPSAAPTAGVRTDQVSVTLK
ncbi:MAG: transmembrane anchor protein, partial [Ramlibacter sp.]|nr:transmembrane anchor protein [Ramlibacter sp.]